MQVTLNPTWMCFMENRQPQATAIDEEWILKFRAALRSAPKPELPRREKLRVVFEHIRSQTISRTQKIRAKVEYALFAPISSLLLQRGSKLPLPPAAAESVPNIETRKAS